MYWYFKVAWLHGTTSYHPRYASFELCVSLTFVAYAPEINMHCNKLALSMW